MSPPPPPVVLNACNYQPVLVPGGAPYSAVTVPGGAVMVPGGAPYSAAMSMTFQPPPPLSPDPLDAKPPPSAKKDVKEWYV